MENKIQQLTEKVYREGVEKGEAKAKEIEQGAGEKAKQIVSSAKEEAEKIIADAKKQAEELKKTTESEIALSGQQAIGALKQQITDLIVTKATGEGIAESCIDAAFLKEVILTVAKNWSPQSNETPSLEVLLPARKQEELQKTFESSAKSLMKEGITIEYDGAVKTGFRIGPSDGSFKISLTEEDFNEFFKDFLRPRTRSYLFEE
jgi:V/A-type H+-transporting ATPase subunit E